MGAVSVDQRAPIGPLPVGAKLGRYEILAKLAAGGMAIVYVARAHGVAGFERLVAIKVLHGNLAHEEEFIKMFLDEARLAASIRHPNVVPTIDISDSEKSGYFIVMEYIEGDHLGQLLSNANKAGEKLSIPVTLRIIGDALGGLGAAHDLCDENGKPQNLVHRDVSPHNIMVGRDGVARLTDFGVAKAEDRLTHTRDGQVKGKLAYMAPEQAASGTTDTRSDLFSMGVIMWECVTGHRLMRAETTAATLHKLLHSEIPKVSSVDPALWPLDPVLEKALSRDPAGRFQSAEEFARALEDVAGQFGGAASLREVGRMVKHYAAVKLKRDKKLIDEALKALRPSNNVVEPEGMVALDEVSSPSSPSTSDISIMAGAAPASLFAKAGTMLANDTMPGTRRASRRVPPPVTMPPRASNAVAVSARGPAVRRSVEKSMSVEIAPQPRFHALHDTLELEPPRQRHKTLVAVTLVAVALLGVAWTWTRSSNSEPEVVRVEEMDSSHVRHEGHMEAVDHVAPAEEQAAAPADESEVKASAVVPVATVPAPVTERRPATQAIAPVVPSVAAKPTSAAQSVRKRETAPARSSKPARRQRERAVTSTPRAPAQVMRPNDVIPNPYHD